jgi:uncharacterized membrane protein
MSLPNIPFPFELPLDIPLLVHPAVVHFAVAIPVVILLLEIINLFFKKRAISLLSLFLIVLVVVSMSISYFTGAVDGKEAYSLLIAEGQAELKEHKLLGAYLVYGSVALLLFKLLFMAFSKIVARLFFIILIIGFIAITLKQGKDGGELVYKYGANSKALTSIKEKLDELQEEYNELEEEQKESEGTQAKIKELQEKYDTLLKSSKVTEERVEDMVVTEDESKAETSSKVEVEKEESNSSVVSLEIPSDSNNSH